MVMAALAFLVNPLFTVGVRLQPAHLSAVAPLVGLGVCALVAACVYVARMDVGLEVAQ
jgi:hypothetical protein